jgi:hypothetical protein
MGIFYEQTEVINRTSKPLNVRYDGTGHDSGAELRLQRELAAGRA